MFCGSKLPGVAAPPGDDVQTQPYLPSEADTDDDAPSAAIPAPETVGGFRLVRVIGSGGMGAVYEGERPETGQKVAVKLLSPKLASNPNSVERFKQEGLLASQLAHPHCVYVLAADTDAGRPYIVMELMPGRTLKDVVEARGPLPAQEAIERILDVIDGLAEAHRVGMIHRDIKPSNCFLTADDRVKVGDFGLSKSLTESHDHHLTQSGAFLGTVLFASPEQIRGEPLDYGSDVYSVCATLYYLLSGQAPFHHESLTAALAKAISEDPPSLRQKRPDVPRRLEAVVMKGLERARERRWHVLDELREALINLLPSRHQPARPRALVSAYLLDRIALAFLTVPLEIVNQWAAGRENLHVEPVEFTLISVPLLLLYFSFCEGVFGATPGKWLLGLRVSHAGQSTPPGVVRALVRAVVFHLVLAGVAFVPQMSVHWFGKVAGGVIGVATCLGSLAVLCLQLRKKWKFRGIHDFISGCHVTQKALPARKLRLLIDRSTPLDAVLSEPSINLPKKLGPYTIRGRLTVNPSGEQLWAGEDGLLSRRVLIWLTPETMGGPPAADVTRPTRLRRLGGGTSNWDGLRLHWVAFAAPLGGPLETAVARGQPLPWADARFILEQLVEELRAGEADGSLPATLGLDQVWVEPNGRLQLLDGSPRALSLGKAGNPLDLLREVVSLTLEGRARPNSGVPRAPVPPHAAPILQKLFYERGYTSVSALQRDLIETQSLRPEVTPAVRAAQLGIQAAIVGGGLFLMFLLTFCIGVNLTFTTTVLAGQVKTAQEAMADPTERAELATHPELADPLQSPQTAPRLEALRERMENEARSRRAFLFAPQRFLLEKAEEYTTRAAGAGLKEKDMTRQIIQWAGAPPGTPRYRDPAPWPSPAVSQLVTLAVIPCGLILGAMLLRGGLSFMLTGVALVKRDGGRARRRQCALRAAVVWLPIALLLISAALLHVFAPQRLYLATGLWLIALALLPIYVAIALRFPTRGPQDRLAGTYLVPL
jgi:uncharacterized RDD family membrane protein YckC